MSAPNCASSFSRDELTYRQSRLVIMNKISISGHTDSVPYRDAKERIKDHHRGDGARKQA